MNKKFKILAVGTSDPGKLPVWVGYLKTFLESKSSVKDIAKMEIISPKVLKSFKGTFPAIQAENPDMITFTPHEDWNTEELIQLCKEVKAWKNIPVVICAENPRNRLQREAAEQSKAVDFIIHGEAEYPLEAIAKAYAKNEDCLPEFSNMICLSSEKKIYAPSL